MQAERSPVRGVVRWMSVATQPRVVRRALKHAVIVGTILIGINYGDMIFRGETTLVSLLKMGLTVLVPFVVSTSSTVATMLEFRGEMEGRQS